MFGYSKRNFQVNLCCDCFLLCKTNRSHVTHRLCDKTGTCFVLFTLKLISCSFATLGQCFWQIVLSVNFAKYNIIIIARNTSIPKATHFQGVTMPLWACVLIFFLVYNFKAKWENFASIITKIFITRFTQDQSKR